MGIAPTLAIASAFMSVVLFYAGLGEFAIITTAGAVIAGILALIMPGEKTQVSGRVAGLLAMLMAASPLAVPKIQELRLKQLEARRAVETKPLYEKLEASVEGLKQPLATYYKTNRIFPDFTSNGLMPYVDETGTVRTPPPATGLAVPQDPFSKSGANLRWVAINDQGVALVSVGQDGVAELPLPGISIDKPDAYPLVGWAMIGVDPRRNIYDPAKGALALGDVVRWLGKKTFPEIMAPLFQAWELAESRSPYNPTIKERPSAPDPNPQSERDARAAEGLLNERYYLAALALSCRAIQQRSPYDKEWKPADFTAERTKGMALYQLGAFREAADALNEYVGVVPNDATAHFYLAAALYQGGDPQNAKTHCAAAAQISLTDPIGGPAQSRLEELERGGRPQFPRPWWFIEKEKASQP